MQLGGNGAPERIRTSDLCLRRAALYPAELRVQSVFGSFYKVLREELFQILGALSTCHVRLMTIMKVGISYDKFVDSMV